MSMLPLGAVATTTTRIPANTAEAALVPCADCGIRHTSRFVLAAGVVVRLDGQQARELTLRSGVGLQTKLGRSR